MNKRSAIAKVNNHLGYGLLNGRNTSFANINASKGVWWLNVNPNKFTKDLHLLLVKTGQDGLVWLTIKANTVPAPERVFRKRQDNGLIDIEISTEPSQYLTDVKSGGTRYNFSRHIVQEWELTTQSVSSESIIRNDLHIVGCSPVLEGTQVPVKELHAYMRKDWNLYGFLHEFLSVNMEQALAEIEQHARKIARKIIYVDQNVSGGVPVFQRTDVPVKCMFDYLADVRSLKDFHWDYPLVSRSDTSDAVVTSGWILELDAYRGVENGVVHSNREIVSGATTFVGSRMPIRIVFDYLSEGKTLKDFYYDYDTGTKEHLAPALQLAHKALEREFYAAASR